MNKYLPENDRYWPVGRAGVAGLTPVSTYRGRDERAPPRERGNDGNDTKGAQSNEAHDPFAGGPVNRSNSKRMERTLARKASGKDPKLRQGIR